MKALYNVLIDLDDSMKSPGGFVKISLAFEASSA